MKMTQFAYALAGSAFVLAALNLSGCVTARETYTSSGGQGYKLTCNGHMNSWEDCLAKAGDMCRERGYTVLEKDGERLPFAYSSANATSDVKARLFAYDEHDTANAMSLATVRERRSMLVMCGTPSRPAQIMQSAQQPQ